MIPRVSAPILVLVVVLASPWTAAEELPEHVFAPAPEEEVQDVLFFADARPVFLRFHVRIAGDGFRTAWGGFAGRLHGYLDANGDGVLTPEEASRGNWQQGLLGGALVARATAPANNAGPAGIDSDKDGKITVDELAAYLRSPLKYGEFGVQPGTPPDPKAQALFTHLDRDHDGKLSAAELATTDACIVKLDLDEDELISLDEMKPYQNTYAERFQGNRIPAMNPDAENGPFVALGPGEIPPRLVQRLLVKYNRRAPDGGKDGRLSPAELGLDPSDFRRHDVDGDGGLGTPELASWLRGAPPDLEFNVTLDAGGQSSSKIETVGTSTRRPSGSSVLGAAPGGAAGPLRIALEGVEIELVIRDTFKESNIRDFYNQRFNVADADKNGYLEKKEAEPFPVLQQLFATADRDGDGKLFKKELDAYFDRQSDAIASRTMLTVSDRGRALFGMVDVDGDQKLGVRELRRAGARLSAVDHDGDGRIAQNEIPHHYQLGVGRGPATPVRRGLVVESYEAKDPPGRKGGPPWFEKMDRNRDGDVSSREFLGSRADFRRLDGDGDGLIDPDEAAKAP